MTEGHDLNATYGVDNMYYLISEEPQLGIITKLEKLLLVTCHLKNNNFFSYCIKL